MSDDQHSSSDAQRIDNADRVHQLVRTIAACVTALGVVVGVVILLADRSAEDTARIDQAADLGESEPSSTVETSSSLAPSSSSTTAAPSTTTTRPWAAGPISVSEIDGYPFHAEFGGGKVWLGDLSDLLIVDPWSGTIDHRISPRDCPSRYCGFREIMFDGTNMWVSVANKNEVWVFDAESTRFLGSVSVGTEPQALAFDGAYVWVTNRGEDTVSVIDTESLVLVDTVLLEDCGRYCWPDEITFDGTHMWVSRGFCGVEIIDTQSRASVEIISPIFSIGHACLSPSTMTFDGTHMWVQNAINHIEKINTEYRVTVWSIKLRVTTAGDAVVADRHLWVNNSSDRSVSVIALDSGELLDVINLGFEPSAIAFDGSDIWVAGDDSLARIPAT